MLKTVIFDMGGTLLDSPPIYVYIPDLFPEIDKESLITFSINKFRQFTMQNDFITVREMFENVLIDISKKYNSKNISKDANDLLFKFYLDRSSLFDDAVLVLEYLKNKNIKLIMASDADTGLLLSELRKFEIEKYFSDILISENIRAYKSSDTFNNAIRNILPDHYSKNEIIFVGDADVDINTAIQLNICSILIDNKNNKNNFNQDFTVNNLKEIIDIIGRL